MSTTDRHVFLATGPLPSTEFAEFARGVQASPIHDFGLTNGIRQKIWGDGERELNFIAHALSGRAMLIIVGDAGWAEEARATFDLQSPDAVVAEARQAEDRTGLIRAIYALSTLLLVDHPSADDIRAFLGEKLLDDREFVRWAAAKRLADQVSPEVLAMYEGGAERHDDIEGFAAYMRRQVEALEDGTLNDTPTDSTWELLKRAREGAENQQWKRVAKATDALIDQLPNHTEGLYLRALAYEAEGRDLLAVAMLGAAKASTRSKHEGELDDLPTDEIAEATERLAPVKTVGDDVDELLDWMRMFRTRCRASAAAAMAANVVPQGPHEALFLLLAAGVRENVDELRRAHELAPDSPDVATALAAHLRTEDPDAADAILQQILEGETNVSVAATEIAEFHGDDASTRLDALAALTCAAYERGDYDRAGELADRWVVEDPTSAQAWQIRPNARTFADRYEEAIPLYRESIETLDELYDDPDRFFFGDDARGLLYFNLSCVLAKCGAARDEVLDALRRAVRIDEKWAGSAVEDDWFGELLDDPDFVAITTLEPKALRAAEELTHEHIDGLVTRALGLSHRGEATEACDVAEEAAELAEHAEHADLQVRAWNVLGWTHAFYGDRGYALEVMERAVTSAAEADAVDDALRAETLHHHGVVLQAADQHERARQQYERALELRRETHGDDHPCLAKSLGDMARLARALGDFDEARSLSCSTIELLDAYLESADPDDEAYPDALVDHAISICNLGYQDFEAGDHVGARELLPEIVASLQRVYDEGYTLDHIVRNARALTESLIDVAGRDDDVAGLRGRLVQLDDLVLSDIPEVRREQKFWSSVRDLVAELRAHGMSGARIAEVLRDAVRGDEEPTLLAALPALGNFQREMAERVNRDPGFLATSAIALSTALETGDIEQALDDMEAIAVGNVYQQLA